MNVRERTAAAFAALLVVAAFATTAFALGSNDGKTTQLAAKVQQQHRWVVQFRKRWKAEKRTAARQADVIRALRDENAKLALNARALRNAMKASPYGNDYLESALLCIHSHEGSWTDRDAPFWGGLQMDRGFQQTYGPEFLRAFGTADHWPRSVQIAVAIKAYLAGRGFGPWPNTRRQCGI